jgi:hypothetical protein
LKKKMRGEFPNKIGASVETEYCSKEQSTPRHKDLEAGIWITSNSSRAEMLAENSRFATTSYSQLLGFWGLGFRDSRASY